MPSSMESSGLLCPDKTRQYEPPKSWIISIHFFCFEISFSRKLLSRCVKSGEQHNIGICFPLSSTSRLKAFQFFSDFISKKPAYHSSPSISRVHAISIQSDNRILPSTHNGFIYALGNAANLGMLY